MSADVESEADMHADLMDDPDIDFDDDPNAPTR